MTEGYRPGVVITAYRRPRALQRLLGSLRRVPPQERPVPLLISLEGGAPPEVRRLAHSFEGPAFAVEVVEQPCRLGLSGHILWALSQSERWGGVILLEDDHYVSPYFYEAAVRLLEAYGEVPAVAGISLYRYPRNEVAHLPFEPIADGYDVFFHQRISTRGMALSVGQWRRFSAFRKELPPDDARLPMKIRRWPRDDWERQFNLYTLIKSAFFAYPRWSFVTNFGDVGQHIPAHEYLAFQSPLTPAPYLPRRLPSVDESRARYDHYSELLPECLFRWRPGLAEFRPLTVDLYGTRPLPSEGFVLSFRRARRSIASYELALHPHELNVIDELPGRDISLARASDVVKGGLSWRKRWQRHRFHYPVLNLDELARFRLFQWWERLSARLPFRPGSAGRGGRQNG